MAKFRKRPVVIDAIQWTGSSESTVRVLAFVGAGVHRGFLKSDPAVPCLMVHTLESDHEASVGDWIVRGILGEFYPVKPEIFEATYAPAADVEATGVPEVRAMLDRCAHELFGMGRAVPPVIVIAMRNRSSAELSGAIRQAIAEWRDKNLPAPPA